VTPDTMPHRGYGYAMPAELERMDRPSRYFLHALDRHRANLTDHGQCAAVADLLVALYPTDRGARQ
jgi:hypothetical protein